MKPWPICLIPGRPPKLSLSLLIYKMETQVPVFLLLVTVKIKRGNMEKALGMGPSTQQTLNRGRQLLLLLLLVDQNIPWQTFGPRLITFSPISRRNSVPQIMQLSYTQTMDDPKSQYSEHRG